MGDAAARETERFGSGPVGLDRQMLVKLLAVAKHRLADIEACARRQLGSMNGDSPPESTWMLEASELQRLKAVLDVQRIQDELSSLGDE